VVYLIIGNGPAGISAIESIRQIDDQGSIILISKENNQPYSRIMTPEYMTGEVEEEDLFFKGTDVYANYNVETRLGKMVEKVLPEQSMVVLDDGEKISYDKLLIASGSRPIVPSFAKEDIKGVFTLWDKIDSERVNNHLPRVKKAVIVGGGLVGLQMARSLTAYGIDITIIEKMNRLMPLQLDETASDMVKELLIRSGIKVLLDTEVVSLETDNQEIKGVLTKETKIPADMVLLSIGVRPNLEMVHHTSLEIDRGLLVNEYQQTNIRDIYVAGDVAQALCRITGGCNVRPLWPCAIQQGKVAGTNMAGGQEIFQGSIPMNSFQIFGLSVVSFGQIEVTEDVEEKIISYPASGAYQKLFLKEGKLLGIIFVGDIQQAGLLFHKHGKSLQQGYFGTIPLVEVENVYV